MQSLNNPAPKLEPLSLGIRCELFLKIIERFREIDSEMQAQSIAVILKVAKHPVPIKMAEIAEELGLSQSTVSRNVAYLGDWNRHKTKGHGMLEAYEDPMERRRKLVRLTAKGKRFLSGVADIFAQAYPAEYLKHIEEHVLSGGSLEQRALLNTEQE